MHLPRFEQISALKHHCGICKTPFSNPNALSTCIGKHEVICSQYHFMFHFVGTAHTCKACNKTEAQQKKRHRAIIVLLQEYRKENGDPAEEPESLLPVSPQSPHQDNSKTKKERKADKRLARLSRLDLSIVTQAEYEKLERIIYITDQKSANDDDALADALAIKFQPNVFREKRMLDTLMAPPKEKPDPDSEVERVVLELQLKSPKTKAARNILERIKTSLKEDLDVQWRTEVEMKKRRIVYAQWVTHGAVDKMAEHYEHWDLETGERTVRRYKGDDRGVKNTSDTKVREEDLSELVDDHISVLSNLTRAHTMKDNDAEPQTPVSTSGISLNDTRHGGHALNSQEVLDNTRAWNDATPMPLAKTSTPILKIVTKQAPNLPKAWESIKKPEPLDLSVKLPEFMTLPKRTAATSITSSPGISKSQVKRAWNSILAEKGAKPVPSDHSATDAIQDMLQDSPPQVPLNMAKSIRVTASPTVVDDPLDGDEWTTVGRKRSSKLTGSKKKGS